MNPVRAGLVTSPGDYPWSSHRCYLGTLAKPWVDADAVLASLASERGEAQRAFAEFCGEAVRRPECMDVARDMLGRSAPTDASPGETSHKPLETLEQIVREVCECHGVSEARLMAQGKNHWLSAVRAEIAVRATAEGVASLGVVARRLNRHTSSLARAAARWRRTHSSAECNTTNPVPLLHKGYAF